MAALLTSKDFAAHLHTAFRIETPLAIELEMAEVTDRSNAQVEQFSVLFTGPVSPWLPQGIYMLLHLEMQEVSLFLVPLGPQDGKMIYEAVFASLIETPAPVPGV